MSVYACTDLHGMLDLYNQIDKFLKSDDKVFFLGDAGDRGPQPFETIQAILSDKRFTYLMGNHERMLIDAMSEYLNGIGYGPHTSLLVANGGSKTFDTWMLEHRANPGYIHALRRLPYFAQYTNKQGFNILMTHSGGGIYCDDGEYNTDWYEAIWDRKKLNAPIPEGCPKDTIIVHGHTPTPYVNPTLWEPGALYSANGHRINLDNGSFATGYAVLFDLDTFDEHIFQTEVKEDETYEW